MLWWSGAAAPLPQVRGADGGLFVAQLSCEPLFPEQIHLLVAAGDAALRQALRESLATTGFVLEECASAQEALQLVRERSHALVLVGPGIRGSGAIEACRKLRALSPGIGIVMIRDGGAAEDDASALEAAADDCVAAPFRFREMVARLGAVLRRVRVATPQLAQETAALRAGSIEVDVQRRSCWRSGTKIHLSPKEFDLLVFLMQNQEVALPHLKLLRAVWGLESHGDRVYLRAYVKALRKKIEADPANPEYILTERWVGYRFHVPRR